ncbi:VanZ family protein [Candidatus Methylocalor cossyra]|uniref:VanZ like protein n=1 Tax=Candidatus Methylocalor cossyra TaxID=3108543 RepID=A0ABM9NIR0_9GAMM
MPAPRKESSRHFAILAACYAGFVVYGSLIPFEYRDKSLTAALTAFRHLPFLRLGVAGRADWIANLLLYIPLAFFLAGALSGPRRTPLARGLAALAVAVLCSALAVGIEFAQLFFPQRTVSLNDVVAEMAGSVLGAALWLGIGARLEQLRQALAALGAETPRILVALYCAAYLLLALFPYDFLVSWRELGWKLRGGSWSFWQAGTGCVGGLPCAWARLAEILAAVPLGVGLGLIQPPRPGSWGLVRAARWGLGLGLVLEAAQFLTASNVSQGVSVISRGLGVTLGYTLYRLARRDWLAAGLRALGQPGLLLPVALFYAGLLVRLILAGKGSWMDGAAVAERLSMLRLVPFYYHYYTSETRAVESFVTYFMLYAPIGVMVLAWGVRAARPGRPPGGLGVSALLGFLVAAVLEAVKLFLPQARPDPTNAWIGALGAAFAWWAGRQLFLATRRAGQSPAAALALWPYRGMARLRYVLAAALLGGGGWLFSTLWAGPVGPTEMAADERFYPKLPEPSAKPAAPLPGFQFRHPRLPAPSAAELAQLRAANPGYLARQAQLAGGGAGDLEAAVLAAYARLQPIDLGVLFQRLMALEFSDRGEAQVKPLALAYDWLHGRWSAEQRAALLDKTLEGCRYEIDLIRKARLSPYNVFLYNGPLPALLACAIAVYGDRPDAAPVMNFTEDLWKHRVLPVWRQIMGRHGGWHEGGEYVGIGIGQAVYQLPALWRAATGEDLFASEPGLKGFLDFLVYRTRPDGTHLRLGDGSHFNRDAPDRIPLAIEYRHPAAYTLGGCPAPQRPSAWPWGPLTRQELCQPDAVRQLPPEHLFDGIGLVVARSGWDPDATLVTFKAGDNYWSHSHLDQGSFTIYKGGALAIDSGFYGPHYGSDHHMNYAYQTVAHNAITVTDPADTAPMPTKQQPRAIANDGGQRRVGSGWGQDPAPLDLDEWQRKRETYHTATLLGYFAGRDLVLATADLTPAYTHRPSRAGSFFSRTRRVEKLLRTFLYDRSNDLVVVYDRVRATDPSFVKRALVHSLERPEVDGAGFRVRTEPEPVLGRAGGILEVRVLWPEQALIDPVGGPGAEFWVDNRNYDEGGQIWAALSRRPEVEAGRWRVEIKPRYPARDDEFLMVLKPRLAGRPEPGVEIRKLSGAGGPGCEIVGPKRTLRVAFPRDRDLPAIELDGQKLGPEDFRVP